MGTEVSHAIIMGVALIMISALIVSAFSIFSCAQQVMQGSETEQTVVAEQIEEEIIVTNEGSNTVFNIVIMCFNAIFTAINLWIYRKENKGFHFSYDAFASKVYKLYNYLYHDDAEY